MIGDFVGHRTGGGPGCQALVPWRRAVRFPRASTPLWQQAGTGLPARKLDSRPSDTILLLPAWCSCSCSYPSARCLSGEIWMSNIAARLYGEMGQQSDDQAASLCASSCHWQANIVFSQRRRADARTRHVVQFGQLHLILERVIAGKAMQHGCHPPREAFRLPYPAQHRD